MASTAASPAPASPTPAAPAVALPLPTTLTPSKIAAFTSCPLAFRFSVLERRPEPPSLPAVRGTLVHKALQLLFQDAASGKRDRARAMRSLEEALAELTSSDTDLAALELTSDGRDTLMNEARVLLDRYFEIEDPDTVTTEGIELDLQIAIDGFVLRGIIDRLDVLPDGRLAVVDYKTGKAPRAEQAKSRLAGVQLYALLCEEVLGQRPAAVRLLYLKDRVVVSAEPSDLSIRGVRQRAGAVWKAIERACEHSDFRPSPSGLCGWCAFKQYCPAFGGNPDAPR